MILCVNPLLISFCPRYHAPDLFSAIEIFLRISFENRGGWQNTGAIFGCACLLQAGWALAHNGFLLEGMGVSMRRFGSH
ncbi:MAG TPA: hypothetical protein DCY61_05500 [Dehalococcoidia bacterium]|nr:hypothetical protein [Dehalococcoidia bacterium]